jgi:hypothetical protein
MQSKVFKKANPENFNKILKRQKEEESDPKFAISDALQEYQSQLEKSAGYQNQSKLNDAKIRTDIVNYVINYGPGDLEGLKGMEFDDAKTLQKTIEKEIGEYEGLNKKGIISDEELIFIKETVGRTNEQLKKVLGLTTKLSLSFRDFKKELKPLKLAQRIGLTNIPIIGKRIERAIESDEQAESKALSLKRRLRTKEAKEQFKTGGQSTVQTQSEQREELAKEATSSLFTEAPSISARSVSKENLVEEERESDKQFETSSGLLEKILIESELTNELLGGKKRGESDEGVGFLEKVLGIKILKDMFTKPGFVPNAGKVATALTGLTATGLGITVLFGGVVGASIAKLLKYFFGSRDDNPNEREIEKQESAFGYNDETNMDYGYLDEPKKEAIIKDEYTKYKGELGDMSFEQFRDARKNIGIGKYIEGSNRADKGNAESMKNIDKIKLYNEDPNKFSTMYPKKSFFQKTSDVLFSGTTEDLEKMYSGQSAAMGLMDTNFMPLQKNEKVNEMKVNQLEKLEVQNGAGTNVINNSVVNADNSTSMTNDMNTSIGTTNADKTVEKFANYS